MNLGRIIRIFALFSYSFTQLTRFLRDRRSQRSRQISTLQNQHLNNIKLKGQTILDIKIISNKSRNEIKEEKWWSKYQIFGFLLPLLCSNALTSFSRLADLYQFCHLQIFLAEISDLQCMGVEMDTWNNHTVLCFDKL